MCSLPMQNYIRRLMLKKWNETEKLIKAKEMQRNNVIIKRKEKKRVLP
jgi:hypothetical protein